MQRLGRVVVVVAACGGGSEAWDGRVAQFADAQCVNACVPQDEQARCVEGQIEGMEGVRIAIGPERESECLACLRAIIAALPDAVENGCVFTDANRAAIGAACDRDPRVDADVNGDPTDDPFEACTAPPR